MTKVLQGMLDAKGMRFALVVSRFNEVVTQRLLSGAEDCLSRHGADPKSVTVAWVPGSWELPQVVARVAAAGKVDAVIALSALVRGETPHFDVSTARDRHGFQLEDGDRVDDVFGGRDVPVRSQFQPAVSNLLGE